MALKKFKKVNAIVSRLKALLSIVETFNRSNTGALSTAGSTSAQWSSVRGSWGISSNKASSSSAETTYPISVLTFSSEYATLGVDGVSPGVGTAFWVTDSGNWWGTYLDGTQTCQTCQNASNCSAYSTCYNPNSGGNCAANTTCYNPGSGGNCANYGTCTNPATGGNCAANGTCYNPTTGGNCAATGTCYNQGSGGNCNYTFGCTGVNPYTPGNSTTSYTNVIRAEGTCAAQGAGNSAPGGSCSGYYSQFYCCAYTTTNPGSGGNCASYGTYCDAINPYTPGNPYTCCTSVNPVVSGNPFTCCTSYNPVVPGNSFTCCTGSNPYTPGNPFTCCASYNPFVSGNPFTCCSSYNTPTNYPCNCTTNHSVKVIKSVSNSISTVATFAFNATLAGFKTILSNGTVTVRGYSGSGYTSQVGSDQSTSTGAFTATKKHGIIKAPTTYAPAQTGEIDEFRVN
ncbi:MAG: hypothetical protein EBX11_06600 [Actinobacteria bacterium]|nr:hypothetical protein [Actinomycetota bacterium]